MPIAIERLPGERILIGTGEGFLTTADFEAMFARSVELMGDGDDIFYRIGDYRQAQSSFMDILRAVQSASKGMPGSTNDPRVRPIYVGTNQWIRLARDAFQRINMQIPTFENLDDALKYARAELARGSQLVETTPES